MIIPILYPTLSVISCPLCPSEFRQLLNHLRIAKHVSEQHPGYNTVLKCSNCHQTFENTRRAKSHKCEAQPNMVEVVKVRLEGGSAIYPYPRGPMGCSLCPWLSKAKGLALLTSMENHFKVAHELGKPSRMWQCRSCLMILDGLRIRRHKCRNSRDLVPKTTNSTSSTESEPDDNRNSLQESEIGEQTMSNSAVCIPSLPLQQLPTSPPRQVSSMVDVAAPGPSFVNSSDQFTKAPSSTRQGLRLHARTTAQPYQSKSTARQKRNLGNSRKSDLGILSSIYSPENLKERASTPTDMEMTPEGRNRNQELLSQFMQVDPNDLEGLEKVLDGFIHLASITPQETATPTTEDVSIPRSNCGYQLRIRRPVPSASDCDSFQAAGIQKLYKSNRYSAIRQIVKGKAVTCPLDASSIFSHLLYNWGRSHDADGSHLVQASSSKTEIRKLTREVGPAEIKTRLSNMANTAPGPDQLRYDDLERIDPSCLFLSKLYTRCLQMKRVPSGWKESYAVLVFESGDEQDINDWRPVFLANCIAKLYAAVLAERITEWAISNKRLSPEQRGFMGDEGYLEGNFLLQSAIEDCRRSNKQLCVGWLDLTKAKEIVSHNHIFNTIKRLGLPTEITEVINDLYDGLKTRVKTRNGFTEPIAISTGLKEGCPLSSIIFSLATEPILRSIRAKQETTCYTLVGGTKLQMMVYADVICVTAGSSEALQQILSVAESAAQECGLYFKPGKCKTLHIDCRKDRRVADSIFQIQGGSPTVLKDGESYCHLGIHTGFRADQTPHGIIDQMLEDLDSVDKSALVPWQKIDAVADFISRRLDLILRGGYVYKTLLRPVDKIIKRLVKKWLNLPQRASAEVVFLLPSQGGAGILPLVDGINIATIAQAYRMLTSEDRFVSSVALRCLKQVVDRKIGRVAAFSELADYLNGSCVDSFEREGGDIRSLWTRARRATLDFCKHFNVSWKCNRSREEMELEIQLLGQQPDMVRIHPLGRNSVVSCLERSVRAAYFRRLVNKPDQGKVYEASSQCPASNHFIRSGQFTRFCDWNFIHRAKLNCLALNGTFRFDNGRDGKEGCRRCSYDKETLPHVLNHCKVHYVTITRRHDAVLHQIVKAIPESSESIEVNRRTAANMTNLRPDLVVTNEVDRKVTIVDVAISFENRYKALEAARQTKMKKYQRLASELEEKGYTVDLNVLVIGSLGTWDPANEGTLEMLKIRGRSAERVRKSIVSETIRWSTNIYTEHITGLRQYG